MRRNLQSRLARIEQATGFPAPDAYVRFLASSSVEVRHALIRGPGGDDWDIRQVFELTDGPTDRQVDAVIDQVGDVLPAATLPIAEDECGNLYLLNCRTGKVEWWDHERDLGDHRTEFVASSFDEFIARLEGGREN